MEILWTALLFVFVFAVTGGALLWIAARAFGDHGPKGLVVPLGIVAIAALVAYTMVVSQPPQTECVDETPQGRGRC